MQAGVWELALIGSASASVAAALIRLVICRLRAWLRVGQRYEPDDLLSSPRVAWTIDNATLDGEASARATQRQACELHGVTRITTDCVVNFEVDPAPRSRSGGVTFWWDRVFQRMSTRSRDRELPYACPRQSPGSRHAFAHRWPGKCSSSSERLSSPGCVPGPDNEAALQPLPCRGSGLAVRYSGNVSGKTCATSLALYAPPYAIQACGQIHATKDVDCPGSPEPSLSRSNARGLSLETSRAPEANSREHILQLACSPHPRGGGGLDNDFVQAQSPLLDPSLHA